MLAGTAGANTFSIVPSNDTVLPSLDVAAATSPNAPGQVVVPVSLTSPPATPESRTYAQLQALWQRAGAAYGIPWQVLGAINKVESNWGRNMGPSSAGAVGWMQFMPSTWLRWGVDANGDGVADPWNPDDAIFSAARYLAAAGGSSDLYRSVYAYNHADWYVHEVLSLADLYGQNGTIAFSLDRLQASLDAARQAAARAGDRLIAARRDLTRLADQIARWQKRAGRAALLSDRLADEQQAGLAAERRDAASTRVATLERTLAGLQQKLQQA